MKVKSTVVALLFLSLLACKRDFNAQTAYSLIPLPHSLQENNQVFELNKKSRIVFSDESLENSAILLQEYIFSLANLKLDIFPQAEVKRMENVIFLSSVLKEERLAAEGYRLSVDKDKVILTSNDADGIFYGVQTLFQLFELQNLDPDNLHLIVPPIRLWDEPSFSYRGMHLDVCRHYFDVDFIKHYLDLMAYYKFNRFHWHLTEDQAWRIEIKKYPKLTDIGAWRTESDGTRYGGFYTQEEIKEVVAYAKKLHIIVVPEIEMPGHSRAALAAYPAFSCTGKQQEVPNNWGVFDDIYCAGKDETFVFIQDVLDEVINLFPDEYIHIGGDEAPKIRWEKCEKCQARMQAEDLKSEHELQSYFIKRISVYLSSKGKKLIGWDEILEGGLAENAIVMSWRGMEGGIAATRQGNQVVMTPGTHCYFDHYQADKIFEPKAIGGYTSLKKVYDFNPIPDDLFTEQKNLILGAQANVWTEYISSTDQIEYMILPRMLALSEVVWGSKKNKNWEAFQIRLQDHFKLFDKKGLRFSKGSYRLRYEIQWDSIQNQKKLAIFSEQYQPKIYFTLDGTEPNVKSRLYSEPFLISDQDSVVSAGIFENGKLIHAATHFEIGK